MLEKIFAQVLDMALAGSFVILAVLLVRGLMSKFPKRYVYALWLIVGIRLICPVTLYSPLSLFNLDFAAGLRMPVESMGEQEGLMVMEERKPSGSVDSSDSLDSPDRPENISPMEMAERETMNRQPGEGAPVTTPVPTWLAAFWLTGMGLLILRNIFLTIRTKKRLAKAVLYRDNIYESDCIPSPLVMGIFRPRIYIPFRLAEQERMYILKHEQYHIHRRDYIIKVIAFSLTAVYWFHPLVWASWFCMIRDMEMSCDEHVLSEMGEEICHSYSLSLLSFATNKRQYSIGTLAFGETSTRKRVKHIMKFRKSGVLQEKWLGALSIVLFVLLGTACLTNGKGENQVTDAVGGESGTQIEKADNTGTETGGKGQIKKISREEFLRQAIRDTMPQPVVNELDAAECRTVKGGKKEITYLFGNGREGEADTLRLDFTYNGRTLVQYESKEYGYLELLSENLSETYHNSDRTKKELEKRGIEIVQQFDKTFLDRTETGSDAYKKRKTPLRYKSEPYDDAYLQFENIYTGDTYIVCMLYDMVVKYDVPEGNTHAR